MLACYRPHPNPDAGPFTQRWTAVMLAHAHVGKSIPSAVQFEYHRDEFEGYLGNVGLDHECIGGEKYRPHMIS